jgi:hypothetical protein
MRRLKSGSCLSLVLLTSSLFASTPDKVQCPPQINCQKCTVVDGTGAKVCKIQISKGAVNGKSVATAQALDKNGKPAGTTNQDICLDSNVPVTFVSDSTIDQAFFEVVFGSNNPFLGFSPAPAIFSGGIVSAISVPSQAATPPLGLKGCYTFDMTFCQYNFNTPISCVTYDPQVIVDGGDQKMMCIDTCNKNQIKEQKRKECIQECDQKFQQKN